MQLLPTGSDIEFQRDVEAFLAEHLDPAVQHRVANSMAIDKKTQDQWTRKLATQGWAAPNWPVEYGGTGWSMRRRHQFEVLMRSHHAPKPKASVLIWWGPPSSNMARWNKKPSIYPRSSMLKSVGVRAILNPVPAQTLRV